jgi:hypothetical protein
MTSRVAAIVARLSRWPWWRYLGATAGILVVFAGILALMDREPWHTGGFGIWTSDAAGEATSQHFADPYSFTHVVHGMIFYWAVWLVAKKMPVEQRFMVALLIEVGWEILENTPPVIRRYREDTLALGYFGDTILNAIGDVLFCILGIWMAIRLPVKWVVVFAVIEELILLAWVRDNLTLNVVMLLFPIEAIKQWQLGG